MRSASNVISQTTETSSRTEASSLVSRASRLLMSFLESSLEDNNSEAECALSNPRHVQTTA